jgi:hypothetical protein
MAQQRIFKIFKENNDLNFSTLLYKYRVINEAGDKKISSKVESPATVINEEKFIEQINNLSSTSGFLHPGTAWVSVDNKSFIILEPKGIKEVYIKETKKTYRHPHPNIAYYITKTGTDKPYVAGMWYYLDDVVTTKTIFFAAWSLNVFRTGFICTHNVYEDNLPKDTDYNILINTAIEDFWCGNFNTEVSDLAKTEIFTTVNIIKIKEYKNDMDYFYQQLQGLADNYSLDSAKMKNTMSELAARYYKAGNFSKLVYSIMRNNPQTEMTSTDEFTTMSNNYVISDIVASAYNS